MPASIKLQKEYGDDLAVIFVESQGTSPADTTKFIMSHRWMGNQAMWTHERPFDTGSRGLPNFALLSADGIVIAKGNHMSSKHTDMIEEEIKRGKGAPADAHKAFAKSWKEFGNGNYAKALAETAKVGSKKTELSEEAEELTSLFELRIQSKLDRVGWLLKNGYPTRAKDMINVTLKGLKGAGEMESSAREVQNRFDSDEVKLELQAATKINRLLEKVYEDGRDEKLFAKLGKMADEFSGTKVGARAKIIATQGP